MAKVTITISQDALSKLETHANAIDISVNLLIKQIAMNYVNENKIEFISSEKKLIMQDFQKEQAKLASILTKISNQYIQQGINFPSDKVLEYFKAYHASFKDTLERLES